MRWKRTLLLLLTAVLLLGGGVVLSQSSTGFNLNWSTIAGGSGYSFSGDYRVEGTTGQSLAHTEPAASASYQVQGGFWPPFAGVQSPPPPLDNRLFLPYVSR
jgi:hypothetical protein